MNEADKSFYEGDDPHAGAPMRLSPLEGALKAI